MFKEEDRYLSLAIELRPTASPFIYWGILNPDVNLYLKGWRPVLPAPTRWRARLNLPRLVEIDIALKPKFKPRWLKRLIGRK